MSSAADVTAADRPEGLRERKKRERGRALRRATLELTLESGYADVTIEAICERAGVSRRTFFNYFANKEEALLGRSDTVFDDEDQPVIAEFEAGGPTGDMVADLEGLLAAVVRSRLRRREEMHQYHRVLQQEPQLMQLQMSRMGNNERLFREMIQRRLDATAADGSAESDVTGTRDPATASATAGASAAVDSAGDPATASAGEGTPNGCPEDWPAVSYRAEVLAAVAMMAIKATFMRLRRDEGEPDPIIDELFAELRAIFTAGTD